MRSAPLIAMTTAIAGLAILISVSVRYMDVFDIDSVRVVGMDSIPASVEAMLSSCYGVNRFALCAQSAGRPGQRWGGPLPHGLGRGPGSGC